jgi:C1A family cysteine protease
MNWKVKVLSLAIVLITNTLHAESEPWTFTVDDSLLDEKNGTGLIMPKDWEDLAPFKSVKVDEELPRKWDWRERGIVTEVKSQGSCGSCWAFGTVAVLESAIKRATDKSVNISEQQLVSCRPRFGSCRGGFFALGFYKERGANYTEDYPYKASNGFCRTNLPEHEKIASWAYVGQKGRAPTTEELKAAIYQHGPIAVTVSASGAFGRYKSGVYNACNQWRTNHIVALVGWDDDEQVWIMKNSWGKKWGEEGYMRIRYTGSLGGKCNRVGETAVYAVFQP